MDDDNLFIGEETEAIDDEGIVAKRTGLLTCARSVGKCRCFRFVFGFGFFVFAFLIFCD